ncbi:MAG: nitroreductase family protein [Lachnospiraceae bacterium]|nr:nitroreductase family protein [Lachnospiraceae bacterium]
MDYFDLIRKRYSVRKFKQDPVPQELLDKILAAGKVAPTAKNGQPWKAYICRSEEALAKANEASPCIFGASTVLFFVYDRELEWYHPDEPEFRAGVEDVSIVATHMMLAATELGIGSLWINRFRPSVARSLFALPENEVPVLFLALGFPADDAAPSPRHTEYREDEALFRYI